MKYITAKGDTFDIIAYKHYGNEELVAPIMQANPDYVETAVFDYGAIIEVPEIDRTDDALFKPPWRT